MAIKKTSVCHNCTKYSSGNLLSSLFLCAINQTIPPFLLQDEMKVKVYNPGGIPQKQMNERFDRGVQRCVHYSPANKLKIVGAVDRMMAEENLKQNQACVFLQVCDSQVLKWQASHVLLEEGARLEKQSLHPGQAGCVDAITSSWSLLWTSGVGGEFLSLAYALSERPAS
jgi:hypothetical protein